MFMEPGMGGGQTCEEVIKLYPDKRVIIGRGVSAGGDVEATLEFGTKGGITKPCSLEQLGLAV